MEELKNCENCKHRKIRKSRGYPCMCCELLNPISLKSKWEAEEVYGQYTDTVGNYHWCGTHSGKHTVKAEEGE